MTLNKLIKDTFEGKRLIKINEIKWNEIIEKVSLEEKHICFRLSGQKYAFLFPNDNCELEESGM